MPVLLPKIELIIFDCDGVLVNSEPLAMRVLIAALARQDVHIGIDEAYAQFLGKSLASVQSILTETYHLVLEPSALDQMRAELFGLFRAELEAMPGVVNAIASLSRSFRTCVASSSVPERLALSLSVTGLAQWFGDRVFSATEVARGKPAPDLFLHAAQSIGVAPEHCLVIEDSPAGIAAAKSAGMRVFGFSGGAHVEEAQLVGKILQQRPDAVFSRMQDLPALIARQSPMASASNVPDATSHFVAVDVGTASVRAGVFDVEGRSLSRCEQPITVYRDGAVYGEYDSTEIWAASCQAVKRALANAAISAATVAGVCFDATCSLVLLDKQGKPLSISRDSGASRDTIAWFDHRAIAEAEEISASGHPNIAFSGGSISPEMELPKLLWLKRNQPAIWQRLGYAFDLADYLTWRATGSLSRSQSTMTSKWTFMAHEKQGWSREFFGLVGLADLMDKAQLPRGATEVGAPIGRLSSIAASELGLSPFCIVAAGMVDAHAGAVGVLARYLSKPLDLHEHLGLIAGTSSCVTALSADPRHLPGFWGPYLGAAAPGVWLVEGGQSATGALLDHIIRSHAAGGVPDAKRHAAVTQRIRALREQQGDRFAAGLHVLADFHGNRSPLSDPRPAGVISGMSLDASFDNLCAIYWRSAVGIAMGLRHIVEEMKSHGFGSKAMHMAGGHINNPLLVELYADATGTTLEVPVETDALLLGSAICAASASGCANSLDEAAARMHRHTRQVRPQPARAVAMDSDYEAYKLLLKHRREMAQFS